MCVEGSTGTPIVMLHGLGSSTTYYQACNALADLAAQHQVVRYDFDGHGLSPVSKSEALSLDDLVEDLKALVDRLGFPTVGIVGHSMSGLVAMSFAAKYPTLVDRLCQFSLHPPAQLRSADASKVLIGPVQELAIEGKAAMKLRASTVRAKGMSAIVDSVVAGATSGTSLSPTKRTTADGLWQRTPRRLPLSRSLSSARSCWAPLSRATPEPATPSPTLQTPTTRRSLLRQ